MCRIARYVKYGERYNFSNGFKGKNMINKVFLESPWKPACVVIPLPFNPLKPTKPHF